MAVETATDPTILPLDQFRRLKSAVKRSYDRLDPFRKTQRQAMLAMCGPHYGEKSSGSQPIPVNMLEQYVSTLVDILAVKEPQVLVLTNDVSMKASAADFENAINEKLLRLDAGDELQTCVMQALFSMGIMKVGLTGGATVEWEGESLTNTEVFMEAIQFDDWVHDTSARQWRQSMLRFYGHRYEKPLDWVKSNEAFDLKVRSNTTSKAKPGGTIADTTSGTQSSGIATGEQSIDDDDELFPTVELWDIFVPELKVVVTFSDQNSEPLRVIEWKGPPNGPYWILGFQKVLNNSMPLPPIANLIDLNDLVNRLYKKLGDQGQRQKTFYRTNPNEKAEAGAIRDVGDGEVIATSGQLDEVHHGGVDQQTLGFAIHSKQLLSYSMGNLDALAGLGTDADTLGQEKIIKASSSQRISNMQRAVVKMFRGVVRDIAFWMWNNPMENLNFTRRIPQTSIDINVSWPHQKQWNGFAYNDIDMREQGDFDAYAIDIEPYSLQDLSPGDRLTMLRDVWRSDIIPLTQFGVNPDIEKYLLMMSKYANLPELVDIASLSTDPMTDQAARRAAPSIPDTNKPNGNYTRTNVSAGMTPDAASQQMAMSLMGAGQNAGG